MKHCAPDRTTTQGSRFRWDPSVFRRLTWGKRFKIHPAYIPRPATNGGSRLHLAAVGGKPTTQDQRV